MPPDKFSAVWISHTSISDFLRCPKAYFLKNVYRDPKTNHKVKIMSPSLALGQITHEVLESLSQKPRDLRLAESLVGRFNSSWEKVHGKKGGFMDDDAEYRYKMRGEEMMRRVMNHPGPLAELSVKINMDLPYYWLSEEENIILCGKIDWLEYLPESDSVHIVDFKTGRSEEAPDSLQLPIYNLLTAHCQKRPVSKVSYWYLDRDDFLTEKPIPDLAVSEKRLLDIGREIKVARQLNRFKCPNGDEGCAACRPYEAVLKREAEYVGQDDFGADVYILPDRFETEDREGMIL